MSSSASGTTSPSLPPLKMGTCSCGTSAGRTATRGCSQPTMGLSSAVTGTQRTGVCVRLGPTSHLALAEMREAIKTGLGHFSEGESRVSDTLASCVRDQAIAERWEQLLL